MAGDLSGRLLALKWKMRHHFATLVGDPTSFFGLLYGCVIVVWLSYVAHGSLHVPPGGFCQDAPRTWLTSTGVNTSGLPISVEFGGTLNFLSIWTTDATRWSERNIHSIESIFFHHPNATLSIYSNKLPASAVAPIARAGFDVRVVQYDLPRLLKDTPAEPWLAELARWEAGPYFYTHVTDVIRLALLFRDGGVYVDTDVILVRPFHIAAPPPSPPPADAHRDAAGGSLLNGTQRWDAMLRTRTIEQLKQSLLHRPLLPLTPQSLGAEAHTIHDVPILNGAIMVFARGSPFLWGAMREFAASYRDYEWGWNGPELLTRVRRRCPQNVSVLGELSFYPFHWEEVALYSGAGHVKENEAMWDAIKARSYAAHLWNKKSEDSHLAPSSVYGRLLSEFRVLPRELGKPSAEQTEAEARARKLVADGHAAGSTI